MKAFLASRLEPVVKTLDLMDLLTRCAAADVRFADGADRISELYGFGTVVRYPSVDADPIVSDVTHALQTARLFHGFVSSIVFDHAQRSRLPAALLLRAHVSHIPSHPALRYSSVFNS